MEDIYKAIRQYSFYHYPYPDECIDQTMFNAKSYSAYAFEELINFVRKNNFGAFEAVEEFRHKMDTYAAEAKTEESSFMFSCMCDAITDFLDWLIVERDNIYERF